MEGDNGTIPICPVCFADVWDGWRTRCGHIFHADCLRPWLQLNPRRPTCPVCREMTWPSTIETDYGFVLFLGMQHGNAYAQGNNGVQGVGDVMDAHEGPLGVGQNHACGAGQACGAGEAGEGNILIGNNDNSSENASYAAESGSDTGGEVEFVRYIPADNAGDEDVIFVSYTPTPAPVFQGTEADDSDVQFVEYRPSNT